MAVLKTALLLFWLSGTANSFVQQPTTWSTPLVLLREKASCSTNASESSMTTTNMKAKKLYPFTEARRIARGHGFSSQQEFLDYECPGAYQLPKNPQEIWAKEWQGWEDWLGVPWHFEKGRAIARTLGVSSEVEYIRLYKENKNKDGDESRLPYRPDLYYKSEWQGWDDFLVGS